MRREIDFVPDEFRTCADIMRQQQVDILSLGHVGDNVFNWHIGGVNVPRDLLRGMSMAFRHYIGLPQAEWECMHIYVHGDRAGAAMPADLDDGDDSRIYTLQMPANSVKDVAGNLHVPLASGGH